MVPLYKNKGPVDRCENHRGILLLSSIATCFHKAVRPALAAHFAHASLPLQLSGKRATPVTFGAHMARSFVRIRSAEGRTCMVLFADIAVAYYTAVRELSTAPIGIPHWQEVFEGLNLSPDDADLLRQHLLQPPALQQDQAPAWTAGVCSTEFGCASQDGG